MSTLQVNTIQTSTSAGVLAVRDSTNALTSIQPGAVRGAAAATAPVFQDSAGTQIGTLARAWVNFNGTGTVAIRAAFNVSSITDRAVGQYTVNFTNALADANYAFTVGVISGNLTNPSGVNYHSGQVYSTTALALICTEGENITNDYSLICVAVFR